MSSTVTRGPGPSVLRRLLTAAGVAAVALAGGAQLDRLFRGGLNAPLDFTAFWAAGHLAANGESPYRGARLAEVQGSVGLTEIAVIAWNPPWTLALLMPFGAVSFRTAYGLWVLTHLLLLGGSAVLLWRAFGGRGRVWVPLALAFGSAPTAFLIGNGQLTAVVLFGLAGFAAACRADRPALAGAALALTATKPHLLIPLGVWVAVAGLRTGFGRRVLLGAAAAGGLLAVPAALAVPDVWAEYWGALTGPPDPHIRPLSEWNPPLIGWWLRQAVPGAPFWVQWVPAAVAAPAVAAWCARAGARLGPDAPARLPRLTGLSLVAAPYGAWAYDLVLLLVPVLAAAARLAAAPDRRAVAWAAAFAAAGAAMLAMMASGASAEWYVWFAPCVLLGAAAAAPRAPRLPYTDPDTT